MRVVKFRGKSIYSGDWLFGSLVTEAENGPTILHQGLGETVGIETIGQYTGLTDKNDVGIFEGDVVNCSSGCPHEVIWLEEYAGTYIGGMPAWYLSGIKEGYAWSGSEEIIGNIHDDPELLENKK